VNFQKKNYFPRHRTQAESQCFRNICK
jgi:hypothetical protein